MAVAERRDEPRGRHPARQPGEASPPATPSFAAEGVLAPKDYTGLHDSSSKTLNLVVKMRESAGNEYQGASVVFDIVVKATQAAKEQDGFGNRPVQCERQRCPSPLRRILKPHSPRAAPCAGIRHDHRSRVPRRRRSRWRFRSDERERRYARSHLPTRPSASIPRLRAKNCPPRPSSSTCRAARRRSMATAWCLPRLATTTAMRFR